VSGTTKQHYINAILAYNQSEEEAEDDISVSDLVEQAELIEMLGAPCGSTRPPNGSSSPVPSSQGPKLLIIDSDDEQDVSEDEQLQLALIQSQLDHEQEKQRNTRLNPLRPRVDTDTDAAIARVLEEENKTIVEDEKLARELQRQFEHECRTRSQAVRFS